MDDSLRALLALADDHLILGQRVAELCGKGPTLEEELALANLGLDLIGQSRALYGHVASLEGAGRTEDELAFLRLEHEYRNLLLVEQPNEDFAHTTLKNLLFSTFMTHYWAAAQRSSDLTVSGIAGQAEKEAVHHRRHAAEWSIRLGDGTEESRDRMIDALETLWPFCGELFFIDEAEEAAAAQGLLPRRDSLRSAWQGDIGDILARATLETPSCPMHQEGGRSGRHSEHMGHLLTELQFLQRAHPGATW